ncbi:MAG: methylamine utilization protein [Pseudohongiellaceae bacterium]
MNKVLNSVLLITGLAGFVFLQTANGETLQVSVSNSEDGEPLAQAVVEVMLPPELRARFQQPTELAVDQVDKEFVPSVSIVVQGSQVSFPNSDDILHHVYSFSSAKTFDIPLYGSNENVNYSQTLDQPGVVEIGCNIHDWMLAYIYVSETTLATISNNQGLATINNLPPGDYQARVWHARLDGGPVMQNLRITTGAETEVNIALEIGRDRRLRRSPASTRSQYR